MADDALRLVNHGLVGSPGRDQRHLKVVQPSSAAELSVAALLDVQQSLTAVERFARDHELGEPPAQEKRYRRLLPTARPGRDEQYAFEVDLDKCTGCKACVAACHALNGLDEDESWRAVGLLHGGSAAAPAIQTVTTSCHHCVDPACMNGCPVNAYEKDPETGIVRHLDDQCFGCQYCTLMCPYDAPKFNKRLGIVRKCDMCSDRLEHGEAPACVQACPTEAIAIRLVQHAEVTEAGDARVFLPGAPTPEHTLPSTIYKTARALPKNLLPADFYVTRPEHAHLPLVVMLTFTQLSVGAFAWTSLVRLLTGGAPGGLVIQAVTACGLALLALAASVLHLGRPWLAWRAVLNLRRSWLSREALAFGLYAKLAVISALLLAAQGHMAADSFGGWMAKQAGEVQVAASLAGLLGVFCSVMVYVATRRSHWAAVNTGIKFFGSTVILGSASVLALEAATASALGAGQPLPARALAVVLIVVSLVKMAYEVSLLRHAGARLQTAEKRMARVMLQELRPVTEARFVAGAVGGVVAPGLALLLPSAASPIHVVLWFIALGLVLAGEFLERYLFFRAAPASAMPGGLR